MAEIIVGSVGVRVVPNADRFASDLRNKLRALMRPVGDELGKTLGDAMTSGVGDGVTSGIKGHDVASKVEGGKSGLAYGREFARAAKDAIKIGMAGLPLAPKLNLDTEMAKAKLHEVEGELDKVNDKGGVLSRTFRGALAGAVGIAAKAVKGFGDVLGAVGWQGGQSAMKGFADNLQNAASGSWQAQAGLLAMIGAALTMGTAVLPVISVVAGAVAGLAAAIAAASLGLGAVGVVAYSVFSQVLGASGAYQTAVKDQAKALHTFQQSQISAEFALGFDKGNAKAPGAAAAALALAQRQGLGSKYLPAGLSASQKATLAKNQAALQTANQALAAQTKSLGPQGVAVSNQWQGIQNQFSGIVDQLKPTVLPILAAGLRLISTALTYLAPIVKAVAPVIVGLLNEAGKALGGPQAKAFADFIAKNAPGLIKNIGDIIGHIISSLPGFIERFTKIGKSIFNWLDGATNRMGQIWNSAGMQVFIAQLKQDAPTVWGFFKEVGKTVLILLGFLAQLKPVGDIALRTLTFLWKVVNTLLFPVLHQLALAIGAVWLLMLRGIQYTLKGLGDLAGVFNLPFANSLKAASKSVGQFADQFTNQLGTIDGLLTGTLNKINALGGKHKPAVIDIWFNVLGQAYNGQTGKLFPKGAFSAPGAVSHSGGLNTGITVPILPQGRKPANGGLMHLAGGGMVWGPGGPRQDIIPIMASAGEFMVNAQSTANNLALLKLINSSGGPVSTTKRETHINAYGYGADQVAAEIVRRERTLDLLYA